MEKLTLIVMVLIGCFISSNAQSNFKPKSNADSLFILKRIIDEKQKDRINGQSIMYYSLNLDAVEGLPQYTLSEGEKKLIDMLVSTLESLRFSDKTRDALLNKGVFTRIIKKAFDFISLGSQGYSGYSVASNLNKKIENKDNNLNEILLLEGIAIVTQGTNLIWLNDAVQEAKFINDAGKKVKLIIPLQDAVITDVKKIKDIEYKNEIEFVDKLDSIQSIINQIYVMEIEIYNMLPLHMQENPGYPEIDQINKRIIQDNNIYYPIMLQIK